MVGQCIWSGMVLVIAYFYSVASGNEESSKPVRKDSLSLNVDSVKIHLSRTRKTKEMPASRKGEKFCSSIKVSCEL